MKSPNRKDRKLENRRVFFCLIAFFACMCSVHEAVLAKNGVTNSSLSVVPFVGCAADGQTGPLAPPSGRAVPVALPSILANQLAFYESSAGGAILAPRGWHCFGWYGSSGGFLLVTPSAVAPPAFPVPKITGPAVFIGTSPLDTSGRFRAAHVAARLFTQSRRARRFVARVTTEGFAAGRNIHAGPYPADHLHYLSERAVEFFTPARLEGIGTDSPLLPSLLPIRGLVVLSFHHDALVFVAARFPPKLSRLSTAIMRLEWRCYLHHADCTGGAGFGTWNFYRAPAQPH